MATDPHQELSAAFAAADARYQPIRPFGDWVGGVEADLGAWDEALRVLVSRRQDADPAVVQAALGDHLRAAAVDTGAIEGLYQTDRGFTMSVAHQVISLDQAEVEKGPDFRRNYEAQLQGFELALDAATSALPLTEALVRRLHEVTCAGQPTYRVITLFGVQDRELRLGTYKVDPNHVQLGDGTFHSYAPVGAVAEEMQRFVEQLRSAEFEAAHPVLQAAYAHHALTCIHPFPDGNGRVARLVASIWLLRRASVPLWIEASDRVEYLDALAAADRGEVRPWLRTVRLASLGLIRELSLHLVDHREQARLRSREAVRQGSSALSEAVLEALQERVGRERVVIDLGGPRGPLPGGIEFHNLGCLTIERADRSHLVVGIGIDWAVEPDSRFVVTFGHGNVATPDFATLDEHFAEDEVVPVVGAMARRRVEALAAMIASHLA